MKQKRLANILLLLTLALIACKATIRTLPRWPEGAIDITRHQPTGDAGFDTAIFGDEMIRYPIWHRLNDTVFAIGDDTIRKPEQTIDIDSSPRLGAVTFYWYTRYDSLGVYRVRYIVRDTLIDGTWRQLEHATQVLQRPDTNCDWQETRSTIPISDLPPPDDDE